MATYIFPTDLTLESNIDIKGYWSGQYQWTRTLGFLVTQAAVQNPSANAFMFVPNANDPNLICAVIPFYINTDPIYCADGDYITEHGPSIASGFMGIENLPAYSSYGYYNSNGVPALSSMSPSVRVETYTAEGHSYSGYYWGACRSILVLITDNDVIFNGKATRFNWTPVEQLAGNDSQFRLNLAQIKEEYIGDPFTAVLTTERERFIFSTQANIARLIANVPNNFETVIAYSGDNYMTVTRRFSEGIAPYNNIFFKFKFYFESGTHAYETEEYGISEPAISYMYLSFIIDQENEVGWIDLITESLTNDNIKYNDPPADLPTSDDLYNIWLWLQTNDEPQAENDPYDTGSTDDGGDPGTPRIQDHITDTPAPTISGLNLGIITLYQPDDYELGKISQFLWSDDVLDNFKKYFNNFADNILALYVLPFTPANLPTKAFTVGKMTSEDAALQSVSYCTQRYFDIDMGSVQIDGRWDSYLDYAPYTRIEVYIPYCGLHSLDIDELMSPAKQNGTLPADQGCTLSLKYRLDILTGVIVAKLSVNGEIRYQFNGKVGANIPLTGQTFSNLLGAIVGAAGGAAVTVATGGMTAPLAVGAAASAAGTVMAQKPNVESIGNISADASMLATKIPYIRISSPNKPLLEKQQDFTGFPSYKSGTLSQFSGYTEVLEAHIEGIACTEEERSEILSLLKAGVIL